MPLCDSCTLVLLFFFLEACGHLGDRGQAPHSFFNVLHLTLIDIWGFVGGFKSMSEDL